MKWLVSDHHPYIFAQIIHNSSFSIHQPRPPATIFQKILPLHYVQ
jgi:hypothetical protein